MAPLCIAVKNSDFAMVKIILDKKYNMELSVIPNAINLSIEHNSYDILKALLEYHPPAKNIPHLKMVSSQIIDN